MNDALHEDRFDRFRCYAMCLANGEMHRGPGTADVCGKCLVGVPCSFADPVAAAAKAKAAGGPSGTPGPSGAPGPFSAPGQADRAS